MNKPNTKNLILSMKSEEAKLKSPTELFSKQKQDKEKLKDDIRLAKVRLEAKHLPKYILAKCKTVFSKYKTKDIRDKGDIYMKLNAFLYGKEKPSDLAKIKIPFQNTQDLVYQMPELKFTITERKNKPVSDNPDVENKIESIVGDKAKEKDDEVVMINYDQNTTVAYLARKFPESYQISQRLYHELKLKFPEFKPTSVLDYGAGLSPLSLALNEEINDKFQFYAVEPNPFMKNLGVYMTDKVKNMVWADSLYEITAAHNRAQFSLVNCSFVLEEVPNAVDRLQIVKSLWDHVEPDGFIFFVLPGSPMGFRFLTDLRNLFRNKKRTEANIIAPCPHHAECPMARVENNWCRFEQSWYRYPKNVLPKLEREEDYIKSRFCYLIIKKGSLDPNSEEEEKKSLSWHRIIRPVKRKGGHSIVNICNSKGKLEERTIGRSYGLKYGYLASKELKWGDLWRYPLRIPNKYRKDARKGKRLW